MTDNGPQIVRSLARGIHKYLTVDNTTLLEVAQDCGPFIEIRIRAIAMEVAQEIVETKLHEVLDFIVTQMSTASGETPNNEVEGEEKKRLSQEPPAVTSEEESRPAAGAALPGCERS